MIKTKAEWAEIIVQKNHTGKMANTLAKALAQRYAYRWQFVDFLGPNGKESAGVVDIVAIRKSSKAQPLFEGLKKLDLFDIILIQVKGGSAVRPSTFDVKRLKLVGSQYHAEAIVLFEWNKKTDKKKGVARFSELDDRDVWVETTAVKLFGKGRIKKKEGAQ